MKLRIETQDRLVLSGMPGSAGWMVLALLLGLVFSVIFGGLAWHQFQEGGFGFAVVMCGLGTVVGQVLFWTGALTLVVGRELLELEKSVPAGTRGGRYRSRSPIVTVPKSFDFDLAAVHAVSVERAAEQHPGESGDRSVDVCRARLLITSPRRTLTLDETSNHRDERVIAVGRSVAEFLGVPFENEDPSPERD